MILVNLLSFFLFLPQLASLLVLFASHVWLSLSVSQAEASSCRKHSWLALRPRLLRCWSCWQTADAGLRLAFGVLAGGGQGGELSLEEGASSES